MEGYILCLQMRTSIENDRNFNMTISKFRDFDTADLRFLEINLFTLLVKKTVSQIYPKNIGCLREIIPIYAHNTEILIFYGTLCLVKCT